jgi:hypothetical protein
VRIFPRLLKSTYMETPRSLGYIGRGTGTGTSASRSRGTRGVKLESGSWSSCAIRAATTRRRVGWTIWSATSKGGPTWRRRRRPMLDCLDDGDCGRSGRAGSLGVSNSTSLSGYHLAFGKNEHIHRDIVVCAVQKH